MAKTTSRTSETNPGIVASVVNALSGTKTYKTTISDSQGKRAEGLGNTPRESQKVASDKWGKQK